MVQVEPEAIDMQPIQVVSTWDGPRLVFSIAGELDLSSSEPLVRSVSDSLSAFNGDRPDVEFDLSQLGFADVVGYRALLRVHDEIVERRAGAVRVSNLSGQVSWLFDVLTDCGYVIPFRTE